MWQPDVSRAYMKLAVLAGVLAAAAAAGAGQAGTRSLPTFEVDRAWPKVPAKWKLGDPSSFAIDARDNVWLLHRPRTLKGRRCGHGGAAGDGLRPGGLVRQGLGRSGRRLRVAGA